MAEEEAVERLVRRLMAAPKMTAEDRAGIAGMAGRGVFGDPMFVSRCVRTGEPPYVTWRAVRDWARDAEDGALQQVAEEALQAQGYDETDPPLDAERLQVVLDLDDPKGWVVAVWRDIYADHGQALEVDMVLEFLTDQHLCWSCGDIGITERDALFWCAAHLKKESKS